MISRSGHLAQRFIPLFLALLAGLLLAQLGGRIVMGSSEPEAADEPVLNGFPGDVDRASRQDVVEYARGLSYGDHDGAGEERPVGHLGGIPVEPAPVVRIEPMAVAHSLDRRTLASGWIVARLINRDTTAVALLGMGARDTVYWWIDSVPSGQWRSVYFSSDPALAPVETQVIVATGGPPDGTLWRQAVARWLWRDNLEHAWVTCGPNTTCRTE